jgi:uncharacterized protein DUF6152
VAGRLFGWMAGAALLATASAAPAHHSTAMFDKGWLALEGTVVDYRYVNPHATISFRARGPGGQTTIWHLEGLSPALLAREEWSRDTLRAGDELKLSIMPMRNGAKGGFWHPRSINTRNGNPFSSTQCAISPDHCQAR